MTRRLIEELNYIQAILLELQGRPEVREWRNQLKKILTEIEDLMKKINKELQNNVQFSIPENLSYKDIETLINLLLKKFREVIDLAHQAFGKGSTTHLIQTLFNELQEIFPDLRIER
jgi:DUF438 domain-containing protein